MSMPQHAPDEKFYYVFFCGDCKLDLAVIEDTGSSDIPDTLLSVMMDIFDQTCPECGSNFIRREGMYCSSEEIAREQIRIQYGGVKNMADIQVEPKCAVCGQPLSPGERIVCVSEATLSDRSTYGSRGVRPGKLRVNFIGTKKAVYHTECYKW